MSKLPQDILIEPLITERTTELQRENKYVFKVGLEVNKIEIKKAVEELFKVKVERVWVMRPKPKLRKVRGKVVKKTPLWKKAIVKLKEGETIEELGV